MQAVLDGKTKSPIKTVNDKSKEMRIAEGEAILASIFSTELAIAA